MDLLESIQAELLDPHSNQYIEDSNVDDDTNAAHPQEAIVVVASLVVAAGEAPEAPPHPSKIASIAKIEKRTVSEEELLNGAVTFLHHHALYSKNCPALHRSNSKQTCSCLTLFVDVTAAATIGTARYMVYFMRLDKQLRQSILMEWGRYAALIEYRKKDWRDRHC
jgi:hypothetical protein